MKKVNPLVVISGVVVGIAALVLTWLGNPKNMGFCIACFERDIAGALSLHSAQKVQYMRPEIMGIILGAFIIALVTKEFRPKAGSSPATRFLLGAVVMIGALAFLGCPLRMVIRIGGGDVNAMIALLGFVLGVFIGTLFLKRGFNLKRAYPAPLVEGSVMPAVAVGLLVLGITAPAVIKMSVEGPGSMRAPFFIALAIALVVGALAQKSRLCMVGGVRDAILFGDFKLLYGFVAIILTIVIGNLIMGNFNLSMLSQPIAHSSTLWNVLGMVVVGWGSVLLGGCPLRQLVLAGEGNGDCAVTVFGMIIGAAMSHNFGWAGNPDSVNELGEYVTGGISTSGKIAVVACIAIVLIISFVNSKKEAKKNG